jgi:predicted nucleic acid-binding protein
VIVLDASAAVELLLLRPGARQVVDRIRDPDVVVHAPGHFPVEVLAAFRGLTLGGKLAPERGRQAVGDLVALDVTLHDTTPMLERAWSLRDNVSAYDAAYVVLAETLGAPLLTADARIARIGGVPVDVEVVT